MPLVSEVISSLIEKYGGNKTAIASRLKKPGDKSMAKMSSQRLGQYADGKMEPKSAFFKRWKEVYGDDIERMVETNVSRETTPTTSPPDPWVTVHKLTDAFILNSEMHRDEVADLKKDKSELWEMIRYLRSSNTSPHKAE